MTKIFLPMGYPWYTPRVVSLVLSCQDWLPRDHFWNFSWFFLNFPGFFQFFTNFYPKICRPPSAAKNFFRPWVVDPYLNFFTHSTKTTQGCYPTLFFYPRYSTKKNFLPWVHTPPYPPLCPCMYVILNEYNSISQIVQDGKILVLCRIIHGQRGGG